jgi:hypothetical protein
MLLIAISVTGLMLTARVLAERLHVSLHRAYASGNVIMTLFYLPFGKLFHVVQRPRRSVSNSTRSALAKCRKPDVPVAERSLSRNFGSTT